MLENKGPKIVAELSGNHDGSLERAIMLCELAKKNGADAVKIQTYDENSLTIDSCRSEFKLKEGLWKGQTYYELYKKAKTPREWLPELFSYARNNNFTLFSSPFSERDVDALEKVDCPIYKIASFELNYLDLIAVCASTKKPLIMSTGLANLEEVERAVDTALKHGCTDLTLLHCESRYPAEPRFFNLNTIVFFKDYFKCKVGLSNHALGDELDIAATALGASLIEKHFTDDRSRNSVDAPFSMEPCDLRKLKLDTQNIAQSLGINGVRVLDEDIPLRMGRRSVYLVKDLKAGEILNKNHVKVIRPALGLEPYKLPIVLGKKAKYALKAPIPLSVDDFLI